MADAGQPVVAAQGAGVAVAVDVQQVGDLLEVRHQPRVGQAAIHALAEAAQRAAEVTHGDPVRQRLRQAPVTDVAVLLRAHVVVLVGQTAAQGEGGIDDEGEVHLGRVEGVVDVLRVQTHFADVAAARGAIGIDRRAAVAQPLPVVHGAEVERERHRRHLAVAHVQHEAVQVAVVEADHREHRSCVVRLGMADHRVQPHRVVEAVLQVQAELLELGAFFDRGGFGAEVHVVEHAVGEAVLRVGLRLADHDLGLAAVLRGAVQVGADGVFAHVLVELGIQHVQVQLGVVADLELQRAGDAQALDLVFGADVARVARDPRVGRGLVGGDVFGRGGGPVQAGAAVGGIDTVAAPAVAARLVGGAAHTGGGFIGQRVARGLRVVAGGAAEAVGAVVGRGALVGVAVVAVLPADRVVAFFEDGALAVGHRHQRADPAVGPGVADQPGDARVFVPGELVVAVLATERCLEALEVERARTAQVDRGAQRAFVGLRGLGLVDLDPAEEFRGKGVEVEAAAAVDPGGAAAGGGECFQTVDAHAGEIRAQAAHGDLLAFAAFAVDRHAGNALHRLGQVQIGELADVFGVDRIDLLDAVALFIQRLLQAFAVGGFDLHLVQVHRVECGRRFRRLLGRGDASGTLQGECNGDRKHGNRCLFTGERSIHRVFPSRVRRHASVMVMSHGRPASPGASVAHVPL